MQECLDQIHFAHRGTSVWNGATEGGERIPVVSVSFKTYPCQVYLVVRKG